MHRHFSLELRVGFEFGSSLHFYRNRIAECLYSPVLDIVGVQACLAHATHPTRASDTCLTGYFDGD